MIDRGIKVKPILATAGLALCLHTTAMAEERFASTEVFQNGSAGPVVASFNILGAPEPNADGFYVVDGTAFAPGEDPKPISLIAPADELPALDVFTITNPDGGTIDFSVLQYEVQGGDVGYTKILLIGPSTDGTPVFVSTLDDPGPAGILLTILGVQLAYCGIAEVVIAMKECKGGSDFVFEGLSWKGVTCSWTCKQT